MRRLRPRAREISVTVTIVFVVTSVVALPLLGGGLVGASEDATVDDSISGGQVGEMTGDGLELLSFESTDAAAIQLQADREETVEAGVDEGIDLAEQQGVEVTDEQREAALEGASEFVPEHEGADDDQVQEATKGAVHGSLVATQEANVTAIQYAVGGAVDGALAQHATVEATQLQRAAKGAAYGAIAQEQRVTVEQIQVATRGGAAGAASEAGERGFENGTEIEEAANGASYGVLEQYQTITVEQRQQVTLEHVQHAATGASAGAIEGVTTDQELEVEGEQSQRADVKQVQKAATGAAKGALVHRQTVTVEQTQSAAWGASAGALKGIQSVTVEQVQQVTITGLQEASFGAATGAIEQSQEATVEQIQAAADGGAHGVLVQQQEVTVTQKQYAAAGAAKGAVESAIQYQVVEIEQIQSAAFGAGEGAVTQQQLVDVTQIQQLARGSADGALSQHQEATVEQIQAGATSASQETARAVQYQRISVTQLQTLTADLAANATAYAVDEGIDDVVEVTQYVEIEIGQRIEEIDELEGEATIVFGDQESEGDAVTIDAVDLSEGGFVAIYDDLAVDADPEAVLGSSAYLEPGAYDDVTVELEASLEESQPLTAVVHHDTTGDETFQYVETDGQEDEPYVSEGGAPILDSAFVTVDEEPAPAPDGTLEVSDQVGDGETLTVEAANASVEYTVSAEYDDERVDSEPFDADTGVENLDLALEPPIEDDTTVDVSVRDAEDDATLASETIEYELEDDPGPVPEAELEVADQRGDGESVTVAEANATVDYAVTVAQEDADDRLVETEPFPAGEGVENESIDLVDPLEDDATLEVSVLDAGDGETLAIDTLEYTLDEEFEVEFVDCTRAEVTDSLEDGDTVAASTGFYTAGGFGNTIAEDFVTIGEDVDAPFTGTIVFEVGDGEGVVEADEEEVVVDVGDYGDYGTTITGISSPEAFPFASIDHPHPEAEACLEETRPELPSISVEETSVVDAGNDDPPTIDVTFGYENPNDASVFVGTELEGTTADEPTDELEPGDNAFTVEWTPETDDERLAWIVDMTIYDYDEVLTAETALAGDIVAVPEEPATFLIDDVTTNSPVQQGEELEVDAAITNVGDEAGTQDVELSLDGEADSSTLDLEADESTTTSLSVATDDFESGESTATISTANDSVDTPVTVEEPEEPATFLIDDITTNSPVQQGEELEVDATITNVGEETGMQDVALAIDGELVDDAELTLEPDESGTVALTTATDGLEPGEYDMTVSTDDDTVAGTAIVDTPATDDGVETGTEPEAPDDGVETGTEPEAPDDGVETGTEPEALDDGTEIPGPGENGADGTDTGTETGDDTGAVGANSIERESEQPETGDDSEATDESVGPEAEPAQTELSDDGPQIKADSTATHSLETAAGVV
ncbi:DUF7282 domain-containing protein [Natronobacterium gregoryi]|uniref:Uncharacterized protein n=2 Tax=Natronobacterium gregoryi TaxID=44930 RepID=L9YBY8_NATGS|nr:CARDB domain-containing protein [Natronobacterium gregoryi]ELY71560.1 hypothetical protein C490_04897 [Natronobacterium gregoryi SP2]PLK19061.1 hypothetical protein CYV19_16875 [Natronobacterium gregoryi SP2]SFJ63182.1 CARDB protein [Natronobacterium gregoryi]